MEFKHFSHQHNLRVYQLLQQSDEYICSGCESIISGSAYGCWECKFFLHERCGNANRSMQHQSHPAHHLTLLPSATYSPGNFVCNGCGETGRAFSFCCPLCEFDLHLHCTSLPQTVIHESHVHSLNLTYALPGQYYESSSYFCDMCQKQLDQKRFWSYNCSACNFRAHTSCATAKSEPYSVADLHKEESPSGSSQENQSEQIELEDLVLKNQAELQRLQLEMKMAQDLAKMMSSFNFSSLV